MVITMDFVKTKKSFVSRYHYVKAVAKSDGQTYYAATVGVHQDKKYKNIALSTKSIERLKAQFPKKHFSKITVVHVNTFNRKPKEKSQLKIILPTKAKVFGPWCKVAFVENHYVLKPLNDTALGPLLASVYLSVRDKAFRVAILCVEKTINVCGVARQVLSEESEIRQEQFATFEEAMDFAENDLRTKGYVSLFDM
jgi:hypothetical protein